jgi:hypothetical protein
MANKLDPRQANNRKYYAPDQQKRSDDEYKKLLKLPSVDAGNIFAVLEGNLSVTFERHQEDRAHAFQEYIPVLLQIYYNLHDELERKEREIERLKPTQNKTLQEALSELKKSEKLPGKSDVEKRLEQCERAIEELQGSTKGHPSRNAYDLSRRPGSGRFPNGKIGMKYGIPF